jgi:uncharacterized protein DUF4253
MTLPDALQALFDQPDGRSLSVPLPAGRTVASDHGGPPVLWLSEEPAAPGLWQELRAAHPKSGLWPLLVDGQQGGPERPWTTGEFLGRSRMRPEQLDVEQLLPEWWAWHLEDVADEEDRQEQLAIIAPHGEQWPGMAEPGQQQLTPGEVADACAEGLLAQPLWLVLVPAERPADALSVVGWLGATNYYEAPELSAVLRSWEDRFGATLVGATFDQIFLSVAAPPATEQHAVAVAAEHFAFCPDNIWQGDTETLAEYARTLVDAPVWSFWWD